MRSRARSARTQAEVKHYVKRGLLRCGSVTAGFTRGRTRESGGDTPAEIRADVYVQLYTFCLFKLVQINPRATAFYGNLKIRLTFYF